MNSLKMNRAPAADAIARFEAWLDTVTGDAGYGGPVIAPRTTAAAYCGPGFDWRYEGLLDGYAALYRSTGESRYLDWIARDIEAIAAAQLRNGSFRNSYFEFNPFEGGMPHEPAMLAAACRARRCLLEARRSVPAGLDSMLDRYVNGYLLMQLWNKLLQTFNDWPTSEFQFFTPHAVAAALELLLEYGEISGEQEKLEHYVAGAAQSLLNVQIAGGPLAGGLPPSSRNADSVSPFLAARCLPALHAVHAATGNAACKSALDKLAEFTLQHLDEDGAPPRMRFKDRPPMRFPLVFGAMASTLASLARVNLLEGALLEKALPRLLGQQMESGAFCTAEGFGCRKRLRGTPDWRDVMPVCGWQDKVYALLARHHEGGLPQQSAGEEKTPVRVRRRKATFIENQSSMRIEDAKGAVLYHWEKKTHWPSVCLL